MRNLGGSRRPWAATAVAAALALCLIAPLMHGWKENNFSKDNRFLAFDRDMFRYLPRDAVYYLNGTHFTSPAIYLHSAYNLRPDVTLIDSSGNLIRSQIEKINGPFKWANLDMAMDRTIDAYYGRLPLVFSYPVSFEGVGWTLAQRGPFFAPSAKADCDLRGWNPDKYGFTPESVEYRDFETRTLIPILYARLAECDFLNGDNQRGLAYVSRANAALPTSSHVALYSGELLDRYGFVNEAADYYQKAIDKCDTYTDAYIQLGNQMIESNQLAAAETEFKRALALSPSLTQAKLALANIASLKGDTLGAAAIYQKLLKADPDSVVVMNNLANAYLKLRRFASASALFKKAFALEPDSLLTLLNYSSYMLDAGRYNEAKAALEKALRIRPSFAYAHYNLGLALLRGGDSAGAIDQFKTTVRLSPKMIGAWTNLIILLLDHGRIEEARGEVALMQRITDQKFIANVIALYLKVEIKAAETNPEDGAAWSNIINTFLRLQQFSKAHETLDTLNSVAKTPRLKELAKLLDEQIKDVEAHSVSKEPLR
jgi:tetratricopeptide (TPR) repeat protein